MTYSIWLRDLALKETAQKLEDPSTSLEDRAKLKRRFEELQHASAARIVTQKFVEGGQINGTLTAIRTERLSETASGILLPRLAIQIGDLINNETARRIIETVKSVDEHFRALFHPDGRGGVELVIIGP